MFYQKENLREVKFKRNISARTPCRAVNSSYLNLPLLLTLFTKQIGFTKYQKYKQKIAKSENRKWPKKKTENGQKRKQKMAKKENTKWPKDGM